MEQGLDAIINDDRDRAPRGPRRDTRGPPRRPRDDFGNGYSSAPPARDDYQSKTYRRDQRDQRDQRDRPRDVERDWVHDKYEDESNRRAERSDYNRQSRYSPSPPRAANREGRLRVENLHYEIDERKLEDLFGRLGDIKDVRMLYDRNDRSLGTAFVTYYELDAAEQAIRDYDGANAMGQPISVRLAPREERRAGNRQDPAAPPRDLFDRIEKPARSLMERLSSNKDDREARRDPGRRDNRDRSRSPVGRRRGRDNSYGQNGNRDRRRSGSPPRRQGDRDVREPREPRARGGRGRGGGGRGGREGGVASSNKKPTRTAEELDAEMNDYWNTSGAKVTGPSAEAGAQQLGAGHTSVSQGATAGQTTAPINAADDLDLMIE